MNKIEDRCEIASVLYFIITGIVMSMYTHTIVNKDKTEPGIIFRNELGI